LERLERFSVILESVSAKAEYRERNPDAVYMPQRPVAGGGDNDLETVVEAMM